MSIWPICFAAHNPPRDRFSVGSRKGRAPYRNRPNRAEAIRRVVELGLKVKK